MALIFKLNKMKKYILILIAGLFLTSCNPFINKDLRKKNRANRKLERLIKKFPELEVKDTLVVRLDTVIVTDSVVVSQAFSLKFDTVEIVKENFRLKLIKTTDTLIVEGGCVSDTIYLDKEFYIPYDVVKKVELTPIEIVLNVLSKFYKWFIGLFILFIALILVKKLF